MLCKNIQLQAAKPDGVELELSLYLHGWISKKQGFREFALYLFDCHSFSFRKVGGSECAVFQNRPDLLLE